MKKSGPPNCPDAEASYLGSVFADNAVIMDHPLRVEDFYKPEHKILFSALVEMNKAHKPIDIVTTCSYLQERQLLEKAGNIAGVTYIAGLVPSSKMAGEYAEIIMKTSRRRAAYNIYRDAFSAIEQNDDDPGAIDQSIRDLSAIVLRNEQRKTQTQRMADFQAWLENRARLGDMPGIPTRYADLDRKLHGWQQGDLIILAARPAMGKTALALNFAMAAATKGKKVDIFSLEMAYEQIMMRLYAMHNGAENSDNPIRLNMDKMMTPSTLGDSGWDEVVRVGDIIAQLPIAIYDEYSTLDDICRQVRRDVVSGLDLVVVDYLQLIKGPTADNRVNEIREITTSLKRLAVDARVPIICLSQLSRSVEARNDKRPILSDLRESGSIEQDADIVLMLYRDEYYNVESNQPWTELSIAKHRNGETGRVRLMFNGGSMLFSGLAYSGMEGP